MHINRVVVVDDHELILAGISDILARKFSIDEMILLKDSGSVITTLENRSFDLYILDLELDDISGFEIVEMILRQNPKAKIIICTMHEEVWYINRLLSSGAKGILLKKSSFETLEYAVLTVMAGGDYLCPRFQKLNEQISERKKKNNYQLTPTEKIVLKHIAEGKTSKEIAAQMYVTVDTIEAHRKNIFVKLGVRNVAQLVSVAIRLHLVD